MTSLTLLKYGRTPLLEADFTKQYDVVDAIVRILGSQISIEHSSEKKQPKVSVLATL